MTNREIIESGQAFLGLEFGSTRIKAVLIGEDGTPLETGGYDWENHLVDGVWTYGMDEVWEGARGCYQDLSERVQQTYGLKLNQVKAIGISGMMHGYLPFNKEGEQISMFRTWRNNMTSKAAGELTELFSFNIPQRWSIAHLYHSILNQEEHVKDIDYITTLSGYVHWKLTGEKAIGIGEASGMFPIDSEKLDYNQEMIEKFDALIADRGYPWKVKDILPKVLVAGMDAGTLTEEGVRLLDPSGTLKAGIRLCPPEGDAGTGMVATNSVAKRTGNVSAGTSAFAMIVLEKGLSKVYTELDMVTTPAGAATAMAHSNNCSTDLNVWANLFDEVLKAFGAEIPKNRLYQTLFEKSLEGDPDCGTLLSYCFHSGEHVVGLEKGCPMFIHPTTAKMNLANFMKVNLYTCFGAMKIGVDILKKEEKVQVDKVVGHGGIFKTKGVAQRVLSSAMGAPVDVMETAGEGGPWGMAILAAYMMEGNGLSLEEYLNQKIFSNASVESLCATQEEMDGFESFMVNFKNGLPAEYEAVKAF